RAPAGEDAGSGTAAALAGSDRRGGDLPAEVVQGFWPRQPRGLVVGDRVDHADPVDGLVHAFAPLVGEFRLSVRPGWWPSSSLANRCRARCRRIRTAFLEQPRTPAIWP